MPALEPDKAAALDTVMRLYGHVLVAHTAKFYEEMDFKNASAERGEGYIAHLKKILLQLTSRNLNEDQVGIFDIYYFNFYYRPYVNLLYVMDCGHYFIETMSVLNN
jgi:hypothetical protein